MPAKPIKIIALSTLALLAISASVASADVLSNNNKPVITLTTNTPRQGQTVEITVSNENNSAKRLSIAFNHHTYKCFPEGVNASKSLIAIPVDLPVGTYRVSLSQENKNEEESIPLKVVAGKFVLQRLSLPKPQAELQAAPGEEEAVDKAKATVSDARLWQGRFILPVKARISTTFGAQRIVNGKKLSDYFHSGIDYAASLGQPVAACANGKVILIGNNFSLHGNTVAIDHGQGIISFYLHLNKILVKDGQEVKAGDIIGKVGQSGRANGPHLHFSLYVNQVSANPNDWYKQTF